jgi:putative permease
MDRAIKSKGNNSLTQSIIFSIIILLMIAVAYNLKSIMLPAGIAYIFALILKPYINGMRTTDAKGKITYVVLLLGGLVLFTFPFANGVVSIADEWHKIEEYLPRLESYLQNKFSVLSADVEQRFNYKLDINPVDQAILYIQDNMKSLVVLLPNLVSTILEWGFLIPLFLFFMIKDGRNMTVLFLKIVPNKIVEKTYYLSHQFNTKFGDYIFAKFIEAGIVGIIITTGLLIMGFPFAFLLGVLAAITNILPYIGPILGYVPALILALVDQSSTSQLGAMTLLYVIANVIDLALVFPILVSRIVNLHPLIVVVSVILGSQLMGFAGMIISIPLAAFFKLLIIELYKEYFSNPEVN